MADGNAELLRRVIEDFDTGGIEAALAHIHPEIVWRAPPEWLEADVYHGHDGLRELVAQWSASFEEYRLDLERTVDLGADRTLALLYQRGRIKDSGLQIEQPVGFVAVVRDRLLAEVDVYFGWDAAVAAAGLPR